MTAFEKGWERTFGPGSVARMRAREVADRLARALGYRDCEDCGRPVPTRFRRDRDANLVCRRCL